MPESVDVPIRIDGEGTFADFLRAARLAQKVLVVRIGVGGCGLWLIGWGLIREDWTFVMFGFSFFWALFWTELLLRARLKRQWNDYATSRRRVYLELHDHGVRSPDDAGIVVLTAWRDFIGWRENRRAFVLLFNRRKFVSIPKRLVSEEAIGEVRSLLAEKIGSGRSSGD